MPPIHNKAAVHLYGCMKKTLTFAHLHVQEASGKGRLLGATNRTEALLELVDTTLGINELVLTSEEGVRVGSNTAGNHVVLNTIDNLSLSGGSGGTSDEAAARGDVHEHNRIVLGMEICLHSIDMAVLPSQRGEIIRVFNNMSSIILRLS